MIPSQSDCLPVTRVYETASGNRDVDFVKLAMAEPKLTLDMDYIQPKIFATMPNNTCFKEITVMDCDPLIGSRLRGILEQSPVENRDIKTISKLIAYALKDFFMENWDSNVPHIYLLSSGFDSRAASSALARLRDELGSKWLGHVLFVCHQPECDTFRAVMKKQGWQASQYYCFRENVPLVDYFADTVDFDKCWKWSHGYSSTWFGFLHLIVAEVIKLGLVDAAPNEIDIYANTCGDTMTTQAWGKLLDKRKGLHSKYVYLDAFLCFLRERYAGFRDAIMRSHYRRYYDPYTWYKIFDCIRQLPKQGMPGLRYNIIKQFRYGVEDIPYAPDTLLSYQFSEDTIKYMNEKYNASRLSKIAPKNDIMGDYSRTMAALVYDTYLYSLASLYEKLYNEGRTIE